MTDYNDDTWINPCEEWAQKIVVSKNGKFEGRAMVILCSLNAPVVDLVHLVSRRTMENIPIADLTIVE
jgi:hypothetical protein